MAKFSQHFEKADGEHGLKVITESGLCLPGDVAAIEAGCTRRYRMVALPNAAGAIMKILDGTPGSVVAISPLTDGQTYQCVKIAGEAQPYAPPDAACPYGTSGVLAYRIVYQEVGGIS